ncbi:three-Cys-motif partner protein TcmP [Camelimonas sp. ID_303_24]
MGDLLGGDDGLPVEEVGSWAKQKHELLSRYIDVSRAVRAKWLGPGKGGATYIDLYCGPGRAQIRRTGEVVDGGCVAAWRKSVESGAPFSRLYIADSDEERLGYATERLRRLNAPVVPFVGTATDTVQQIVARLNPHGLHFAFLDPYSLGALSFDVVRAFAPLKRIDLLFHISRMDLQRNLGSNLAMQQTAFELFAPGWMSAVDINQGQTGIRRDVFEHWRNLVSKLGIAPSVEMKLISGAKNQPLYWLLLAAKHELAHKFWKTASNDGQGELF